MNYIATEGERLDSIYFKNYGLNFNQKQYNEFLINNYKLLTKDSLDSGDIVIIKEIELIIEENTKGLYGIEL